MTDKLTKYEKRNDTLIGIPTYSKQEYCLNELIEALNSMLMHSRADVLFIVNNGEDAYATLIRSKGYTAVTSPEKATERFDHIVNARKLIRKIALEMDYNHLLFLDSDVIPQENTLEELKEEDKDVITGAYLNGFNLGGEKVIAPVAFKDADGGAKLYTYNGMFPERVEEIGAAGLGCTLIKKEVLKKVKIRTMESGKGEDIAFYLDARKAGFKTYINTAVKCAHRVFPKEDENSALYEWNTIIRNATLTLDTQKEK